MELFRLLGTIAIDNTKAKEAINDTTKDANKSSSEVSDAYSKIGNTVGTVAKGIGIAGAALGGAFIAAVESTREYRKEMGLLESAFATAGHTSEEAKKTYSDLNAVMGDSGAAVEASQHLALVTDNQKELDDMTHALTGVYATFGASLPLEGLAEAMNHTAELGEVQGSLADALEWSGITVDDFNAQLAECSTEQERQDLIMKTLKDTYSEAADQYKETNKDIIEAEKANEKLADAFAEVGRIGEPIITKIKEKIAEMIQVAVPKIQEFIDKIKDATQWVKDNKDTIQTWVGIILGATVAIGTFLLILNWGTIMGAAASAVKAVQSAILAMNAAMLANPIGIIVALIVGLVATFIYLWNNVDGFKQFWLDAWEMIKKACSVAWEWIKNTWSNVGAWFTGKFEAIKQAGQTAMDNVKKVFSDAWAAIKAVWDVVKPYFEAVWNHIKLVFSVVKNVLTGNFSGAWEGIKGIWNNVKSYFQTVWNGIAGIFGSVGSWFKGVFNTAWNNIKAVFSGWGNFFGGLWNTIKDKFTSIGTSISNAVGTAVKKGINGVIGGAESLINGFIGQINGAIKWINKVPGVSISKIAKVSFTRLAEGGVLEKGQIGMLEGSGAEAVVPLEKNTKWIDRVSEHFEDRLGVQDSISLELKLNNIITLLEQLLNRDIYLDTKVLVGELAPVLDVKMGYIASNTRRSI